MTPPQKEVLDLTQRYDTIGERLTERQQDLQAMLSAAKVYLEDVQDIMTWLEDNSGNMEEYETIPANVGDAKDKLKRHQVLFDELYFTSTQHFHDFE